jgi:hypothetical protein
MTGSSLHGSPDVLMQEHLGKHVGILVAVVERQPEMRENSGLFVPIHKASGVFARNEGIWTVIYPCVPNTGSRELSSAIGIEGRGPSPQAVG